MRLPQLKPAELTAEQRTLYDEIAGGPRAAGPQLFELTDEQGRLNGPFGAMLLSPPVGGALQSLGTAIRYGSSLPPRLRELAVLAVAAHWGSEFERYAHEPLALQAGLSEAQVRAVAAGAPVELEDPVERAALLVVRALLSAGDLSDEQWDACRVVLEPRDLVELTTLVGYYATLALQLRVFRVGVPGR